VVIIYIILKKKNTVGSQQKTKGVDGRIEKKAYSKSLRSNKTEVRLLQTTTRLFFFYVRVNPTLIKRLRYYTLRIMFRHLGFHTESAHPTGSKSNHNSSFFFFLRRRKQHYENRFSNRSDPHATPPIWGKISGRTLFFFSPLLSTIYHLLDASSRI